MLTHGAVRDMMPGANTRLVVHRGRREKGDMERQQHADRPRPVRHGGLKSRATMRFAGRTSDCAETKTERWIKLAY